MKKSDDSIVAMNAANKGDDTLAEQRSAVLYALFATCKLQSTNPIEWLTDVLRRLPTHPADRMAELLPHHWKASRDLQQATVKKAA